MSRFVSERFELGETAVTIAAEEQHLHAAKEAVIAARADVLRRIAEDGMFLTTFEPYRIEHNVHGPVRRMCEAAEAAGVGPMAAVAGTIAQEALEAMVRQGCAHGWVDNGGDIALILAEPATMEVFSDPSSHDALAFELEPTDGILGVCSSSGRLGHSVSFGDADVVTVLAESASLADALATAIANRVKDVASLGTCFDPFVHVDGLVGAMAMIDGAASMHGRVPRIVEAAHSPERLTAHSSMSSEKYTGVGRTRSGVEP